MKNNVNAFDTGIFLLKLLPKKCYRHNMLPTIYQNKTKIPEKSLISSVFSYKDK